VDLFDVVRACFRRFYVVLPLVVIAVWFAHGKYDSVKPVFYSNAVFALAQPSSQVPVVMPGQEILRNGLVDAGGAALLANMIILRLGAPEVRAQVVADGGQPNYRVMLFPTAPTAPPLPMVMIDATEQDPVSATKTVDLVLAQADPVLAAAQQQAGVPEEQWVKSLVVSPATPPVSGIPSRTRATIAILVAGVALALLAAVLVDVLVLRWKANRQRSRGRAAPAIEDLPITPTTTQGPRHHRILERDVVAHFP
jgi:hypothetical protein